jgi:hypothetical protein
MSVGKTFDTLEETDRSAIEDRARRLLEPLLPQATIERVVADIRGEAE